MHRDACNLFAAVCGPGPLCATQPLSRASFHPDWQVAVQAVQACGPHLETTERHAAGRQLWLREVRTHSCCTSSSSMRPTWHGVRGFWRWPCAAHRRRCWQPEGAPHPPCSGVVQLCRCAGPSGGQLPEGTGLGTRPARRRLTRQAVVRVHRVGEPPGVEEVAGEHKQLHRHLAPAADGHALRDHARV